eukprot:SAG11_NODE_8612_length_995_cov_2.031250_1_plen_217_part_01
MSANQTSAAVKLTCAPPAAPPPLRRPHRDERVGGWRGARRRACSFSARTSLFASLVQVTWPPLRPGRGACEQCAAAARPRVAAVVWVRGVRAAGGRRVCAREPCGKGDAAATPFCRRRHRQAQRLGRKSGSARPSPRGGDGRAHLKPGPRLRTTLQWRRPRRRAAARRGSPSTSGRRCAPACARREVQTLEVQGGRGDSSPHADPGFLHTHPYYGYE